MEIKTIKQFVMQLEAMIKFMNRFIEQENILLPPPENDTERLRELTELRLLAKSDAWPQAIEQELIVNDKEDEKIHRAASVLKTLISTDLQGKKILDVGCGEGHIAFIASNLFTENLVVGYDIENDNWEHFEKPENLMLTKLWSEVDNNAPYEVIIINDVIDHTKEFEKTLEKIIKVKDKEFGKIYIRCHPWTSRHGCHTHHDMNKAFLHLVFSEDELYAMGVQPVPTYPLLDPLESYRKMFKSFGLSIIKENVIRKDVELFFIHNPHILRRIKDKFKNSNNPDYASGEHFPRNIIEIEYIDFTLM